ncbi:hypothetical protein CLOP_g19271 [Closterium sp. NIES-67]|nr:hypothetical protein CLOP_g19271 [Closterium sp. NIES-67]
MAAQLTRCVVPAASTRMGSAKAVAAVAAAQAHAGLSAVWHASPASARMLPPSASASSALSSISPATSSSPSPPLSSAITLSPSASAFRRAALQPLKASAGRPTETSHVALRAEMQSMEELPENLQKIVRSFQMVPDPRARYQQLLYYAAKLKPLAKQFQTPENKVKGCVSQVWVLPTLSDDGRVHFQAESDSQLTKGLAALLVEGLSGATPQQIVALKPDFIQMLGLKQSLTPSRNNGFLNMLLLMQRRTLQLYAERESANAAATSASPSAADPPAEAAGNGAASVPAAAAAMAAAAGTAAGAAAAGGNGASAAGGEGGEGAGGEAEAPIDPQRPVFSSMTAKISKALTPTALEVEDVSHQHAGHSGNPSGNGETHFNVRVVSAEFEGVPTIRRHRLIYGLLEEEFKQGLHALSLVTRTPAEEERLSVRS